MRTHLFQGYDRTRHPLSDSGLPTEVRLQVYVADLWSFDQKSSTFEADLYIRERWTDPRLSYSNLQGASRFERIDLARSSGSVWRSVLYFPQAVKETMSDELLFLYPDGSLWQSRRMILKLKCAMDYHAFPYDSQECPIRLEMWSQRTNEAILSEMPASGIDGVTDNEWMSFSFTQATGVAPYSTGDYAYSTVFVQMTRETVGWRRKGIVPIIIFVLVSYSGYWISPGAVPARVTLGIVSVLISLTLWRNIVATMPIVTYPVWLRDYIMGCVFFNLCSIFTYTVVNYSMQKRDVHKAKVSAAKAHHASLVEKAHQERTHKLLLKQLSTTSLAVLSSAHAELPTEETQDSFDASCLSPEEDNFLVPRERDSRQSRQSRPAGPGKDQRAGGEADDQAAKKMAADVVTSPGKRAEERREELEPADGRVDSKIAESEHAVKALEGEAHTFLFLVKLDWHMRWFFPVAFGIYNLFMFVVFAGTYHF